VIGKNGVEKINELDLNQDEKEWLDKGVNSVKNALAGIDI
jgi:malate dehydrogenase